MKHLTNKRNGKSWKSMSRPHGNKKNKQRVDKKSERQAANSDIDKHCQYVDNYPNKIKWDTSKLIDMSQFVTARERAHTLHLSLIHI